jgi:hypothetical protein
MTEQEAAAGAGAEQPEESTEGVLSPDALLEMLSLQASEAALFPGSLREEYLFAYDLLLDQAQVSRYVKALQAVKIARLPHHRLVWPYYYRPLGTALPSLLRTNRDDDHVWGLLYDARQKDFRALEKALRTPNRYHRRAVGVQDRGGRRYTAFTYMLTLRDPVMSKPSASYLEQLVACATERALPAEWLDALKSVPVSDRVDPTA